MGAASNEVRRLETLIEINALINSQFRDVRVLLSRIMESAERLIESDASSLLLVDTATGQLYFEIALGDKGDDVKKYTLERGEGIAGWVALNNHSLVVNDAQADPRHYSAIGTDTGYKTRNLIAVPLRVKDEVIGVLEVINKAGGGRFDDDDLRFLEVLADQASIAIQNARDFRNMSRELDRLKTAIATETASDQFVWKSPSIGQLIAQSEKMARSESPVLILGESGTGKELLAHHIHRQSPRNGSPLIKVNCAAIPQDLIESELFGYVKGAFTDAVRDRRGYFERADGGTLFLDEIGELSASAQAKLLRVLQDGRYQRVGGDSDIVTDVRVIAATNRDLKKETDQGVFRRDLYYRLAVLTLLIPPLRERPEDIEELAGFFLKTHVTRDAQTPGVFSLEALEVLLSYRWPGNVRELRNAVERAVVNARGRREIMPADLALPGTSSESDEYRGKNLKDSVTLFKKNFIRDVLAANDGNQTRAAEALGIQRTYLSRMIKELNIEHRGDSA